MKPKTPTKIGITTHSMIPSCSVWMSSESFEPAGRKFHSSASAEPATASAAAGAKNEATAPGPRVNFPFIFFFPESDSQSSGELGGEPDAGARVQMPPDLQLFFSAAQQHARAVAFILLEKHLRPAPVDLVARRAGLLRDFDREPVAGKLDLSVIRAPTRLKH